jgi:hypothetical protein
VDKLLEELDVAGYEIVKKPGADGGKGRGIRIVEAANCTKGQATDRQVR